MKFGFGTGVIVGLIVGAGGMFFLFSKGINRLVQKDPNLIPTLIKDEALYLVPR